MTRYRQYPPVFMFIIACIAAAVILILSGCATTGQQPTLEDVKAQACPVILGTLAGLQVSPDIPDATKARLSEIELPKADGIGWIGASHGCDIVLGGVIGSSGVIPSRNPLGRLLAMIQAKEDMGSSVTMEVA